MEQNLAEATRIAELYKRTVRTWAPVLSHRSWSPNAEVRSALVEVEDYLAGAPAVVGLCASGVYFPAGTSYLGILAAARADAAQEMEANRLRAAVLLASGEEIPDEERCPECGRHETECECGECR